LTFWRKIFGIDIVNFGANISRSFLFEVKEGGGRGKRGTSGGFVIGVRKKILPTPCAKPDDGPN